MLVRTLISEGRIVHQTTIEDPNSPTGRRVERIIREGPIALITTTTGELYSENETRMSSWYIHEDPDQTKAVMAGLANQAAGAAVAAPADLAIWHDLQRWIALGPADAVIPFAPQIAAGIKPLMVRFRRDIGSLFSFIKASAILHQAQRQVDAQGRVIATIADYALGPPNLHEGDGRVVRREHSGQRACSRESDRQTRERASYEADRNEVPARRSRRPCCRGHHLK